MIEKGKPITRDEPICRRFSRLVPRAGVDLIGAKASIQWVDRIAMSKSELGRLPQWLHEGDAKQVAEIASTLPLSELSDVKYKRRLRWSLRKLEYWEVKLELRIHISSTGLRFEIWFDDLCIGKSGQITVYWQYLREDEANVDMPVGTSADQSWVTGLVPLGLRRDLDDSNLELPRNV